jgi:hypothetical protein
VRQRTFAYWHVDEVLFGNFSRFGNGGSNVGTLGNANSYAVFAVAHNYQCAETEATATLYDAGYAVNVNHALVELFFFWRNFGATATAVGTLVAALCLLFSHP